MLANRRTKDAAGLVEELIALLGAEQVSTNANILERHGRDESYHPSVAPDVVAFARSTGAVDGQVFALFVMAVAAAEAAVGLALVILLFRNRVTVSLDDLDLMKG